MRLSKFIIFNDINCITIDTNLLEFIQNDIIFISNIVDKFVVIFRIIDALYFSTSIHLLFQSLQPCLPPVVL